jgi:cytochrome c556
MGRDGVEIMGRALISVAAILALGMVSACSGAAPGKENPRTAKFKEIGKANKAIGEELKKDAPSMQVVAANADTLDAHARELPSWFPGTTGPEPGIKSEALPAIWERPAEFKTRAATFAAATAELKAAAATGDVAKARAAADAVRPTCKGCHDTFRLKK